MFAILTHTSILWQITSTTNYSRKELLNRKQIPRRQYRTIPETFSLESKTPLKKPTLYQQSSRGRGKKKKQRKKTPQKPQQCQSYAKMASSRKHMEYCQKNYLLPELFKILLVTKSSSVYRRSITRTSLFHKSILNADEDHPVSSTREDIYLSLIHI